MDGWVQLNGLWSVQQSATSGQGKHTNALNLEPEGRPLTAFKGPLQQVQGPFSER
ncbi:hypothetical protein DC3_13940 [Deinococcus cellulosilyticus NBRC 106333 = KACC 11606]|uniref:Uncharacterized protein n=1 Tax=Deinococcus cellulosilyticus (strain DSM 18568 / NBRC 106333 / KACC 11606 / 5516J-15) TaxID=1223518 RepID=A0A511MYV7_DEIC1|nr:hypothetical protein DC3_13940 [Deinococcus cellulosilyticus NBRC 106333 = KACC 11606]